MNTNEKLTILDDRIHKVLDDFYKEYPEVALGYTGCTRLGEFSIHRGEHPDGLTFRVSDKQMYSLVREGKVTFSYKDMINQEYYDD